MQPFSSTYRIQFNKNFKFADLDALIPYFQKLKIGAIYASPIFKAVSGSTHGYDITNPNIINPEIGTEEELYRLKEKLNAADIQWLQDIVPNHMAFHQDNLWLMDVLEKGKNSEFYDFFDRLTGDNEKMRIPVLNTSAEEAVKDKKITAVTENKKLYFNYSGMLYPINTNDAQVDLEKVNDTPELLLQLYNKQVYEFCNWKESNSNITYRRFFLINGLIGLNMQYEHVFERYHTYIKKLCDDKIFDGLRIDHIDGLYNPLQYLQRLRDLVGE